MIAQDIFWSSAAEERERLALKEYKNPRERDLDHYGGQISLMILFWIF